MARIPRSRSRSFSPRRLRHPSRSPWARTAVASPRSRWTTCRRLRTLRLHRIRLSSLRLGGERVVLRVARPEDADALAQGFADDPTLGAMLGMEPHEENAEFLRSTFREDDDGGEERKAYWCVRAHPRS